MSHPPPYGSYGCGYWEVLQDLAVPTVPVIVRYEVPAQVIDDAVHYRWSVHEHCTAWRRVSDLPRVQSGRFTHEEVWEDVKRTAVLWGTVPTSVLSIVMLSDASPLKPGEFAELMKGTWPAPSTEPEYSWRWKERL